MKKKPGKIKCLQTTSHDLLIMPTRTKKKHESCNFPFITYFFYYSINLKFNDLKINWKGDYAGMANGDINTNTENCELIQLSFIPIKKYKILLWKKNLLFISGTIMKPYYWTQHSV